MKIVISVRVGGKNIELLHWFIRHYEPMVDEWQIHLYENDCDVDLAWSILRRHNIEPVEVVSKWVAQESRDRSRFFQRFDPRSVWILNVDMDEFLDQDARQIAAECDAQGYDLAMAKMVDYIASDGSLHTLSVDVDPRDQFPLACDLTATLLKDETLKTILFRPNQRLDTAHRIAGNDRRREHPDLFSLRHYKWDSSVVSRLESRVEQHRGKFPWWRSSQRALDHLKQFGRINIGALTQNENEENESAMLTAGLGKSSQPAIARAESQSFPNPIDDENTTTRIVATTLSGNNEDIIGDALRSVAELVDEFVLIDTGITDNTIQVAEEVAGSKLRVERYEWCNDFANARNFALQKAAESGPAWALTIDTDERLEFGGIESPAALRSILASDPKVLSWMIVSRNGFYAKERFIRVPTQLAWKGRTHEFFAGAHPRQRNVMQGAIFWETGKSSEQFRFKLERDLEVLTAETERDPDNARWWFYLGQTWEGLNEFQKAIDAYKQCSSIRDGWPEQAAWASFKAAECLVKLKDFHEALEVAAIGMARQARMPELAWLAGYCCYQLGRYADAVTWEELAITLGNFEGMGAAEDRFSFRLLSSWYEGPYDVLRYTLRQMGRYDDAAECEKLFNEALEERKVQLNISVSEPQVLETADDTIDQNRIKRHTSQPPELRVAVLGLYSSGSSATAGVLHHLGGCMGKQLWGDFYEPRWLSDQLRTWWNEPEMRENVPRAQRIKMLTRWLNDLDHDGLPFVAAKHPLLSLCGDDLLEAWGKDTKFIWTHRPLEDSIESLKRRGWWQGRQDEIQKKLWDCVTAFFSEQPHLKIEFSEMLKSPAEQIDRIIEFLGITPNKKQLNLAIDSIQPSKLSTNGR